MDLVGLDEMELVVQMMANRRGIGEAVCVDRTLQYAGEPNSNESSF